MNTLKRFCIVGAVFSYVLAAWIYFPLAGNQPYAFDEADYMFAGSQGLWANYTDRNGLSFVEFVRKGLELRRDPSKRAEFSQFVRSTGDVAMYRHFHGPMYAYWLATLKDLGVQREDVFRGAGLLIHFATATLILFGIWAAFPSLSPLAGLIACLLYVFDRTALVAMMGITQHSLFTLLSVAVLFAASLFFRHFELRWFYAMMIALGLAFCTVETAAVVVVAIVLAMLVDHRRLRKRFTTLRSLLWTLTKGIAVLLLTMLVVWPKGIAELDVAQGFLQLAYMTVYRKTFTPFGTWDLWKAKYTAAPWEFTLLALGVIVAFFIWRRFTNRAELLPWLAFIAVFLAITLKVTVTYTYYYAPLVAAFVVVTAVAYDELWRRWAAPWKFVLPAAVAVSLIFATIQYRGEARVVHEDRPYTFAAVRLVKEHPVTPGRQLEIPFQLIPTLHYYYPQLQTSGYDFGYPVPPIADALKSEETADWALCEQSFCAALDQYAPGIVEQKTQLDAPGPTGQPIYMIQVHKVREAR